MWGWDDIGKRVQNFFLKMKHHELIFIAAWPPKYWNINKQDFTPRRSVLSISHIFSKLASSAPGQQWTRARKKYFVKHFNVCRYYHKLFRGRKCTKDQLNFHLWYIEQSPDKFPSANIDPVVSCPLNAIRWSFRSLRLRVSLVGKEHKHAFKRQRKLHRVG